MRQNIVIVRSAAEAQAVKRCGFRDVFAIDKKPRGQKPISATEAEDIVNSVTKFGIVFLIAKATPEGKRFALEAFRLIGPERPVRWMQLAWDQSPQDVTGKLPHDMHDSCRRD